MEIKTLDEQVRAIVREELAAQGQRSACLELCARLTSQSAVAEGQQ